MLKHLDALGLHGPEGVWQNVAVVLPAYFARQCRHEVAQTVTASLGFRR